MRYAQHGSGCVNCSSAVAVGGVQQPTADNEAELLEICLHGTAAHVEQVVRAYRQLTQTQALRFQLRTRRQIPVVRLTPTQAG